MAHPLCDDGTPVIKSFSVVSPAELGHAPFGTAPGLVRHGLLTPETQVQILSVVDETGSASIGDLVRALPGHPQPVAAVLALVASNILMLEAKAVFDEHVLVRRKAAFELGTAGPFGGAAAAGQAITSLATGDFVPGVFQIAGDARRRAHGHPELARPGVYMAVSGNSIYVGMSENLGRRIASGTHLSNPEPDCVVAVIDRSHQLDLRLTRVTERLLALAVADRAELHLANELPIGDTVSAAEYAQLRLFVAQITLACRTAGLLFLGGTARALAMGVRTDEKLVGPLRVAEAPSGTLYELRACGVVAWAAESDDGGWTLLAGSQVRERVVASASSSVSMLRAEWLYSGLLRRQGRHLVLRRDVRFDSGSGVAHFVIGAKGVGLAGWRQVSPDQVPGHPYPLPRR